MPRDTSHRLEAEACFFSSLSLSVWNPVNEESLHKFKPQDAQGVVSGQHLTRVIIL